MSCSSYSDRDMFNTWDKPQIAIKQIANDQMRNETGWFKKQSEFRLVHVTSDVSTVLIDNSDKK